MGSAEVVDAEVVPEEEGREVVPASTGTLFRTDDPVVVLERATETATALKQVLVSQKLTSKIKGNDHVNVEGWLTLGAMLGVTPVCVWSRQVEKGWEARVEARTLDGRVVGAAESECLTSESRWKTADDYAIRSMAQTRATSKALGSVLRFVVTLAGYSGTPAEEMDFAPSGADPERQVTPERYKKPDDAISPDRVNELGRGVGLRGLSYAKVNEVLSAAKLGPLTESTGAGLRNRLETLTTDQADIFEFEMAKADELPVDASE